MDKQRAELRAKILSKMQHVQSAAYNQWQHDTPYGDYRAEQAIRDVMQLVDRYVVDKRVEGLGIDGK